jgi:hypothetical protein
MASPPSAGATLHPSFGATWEARRAAIAARSTFLRRTHPWRRLRASMNRWDDIYPVLPTRGDCPRRKLSSGNRRRHATAPNRFLEEHGRIQKQTLNLSVRTLGSRRSPESRSASSSAARERCAPCRTRSGRGTRRSGSAERAASAGLAARRLGHGARAHEQDARGPVAARMVDATHDLAHEAAVLLGSRVGSVWICTRRSDPAGDDFPDRGRATAWRARRRPASDGCGRAPRGSAA